MQTDRGEQRQGAGTSEESGTEKHYVLLVNHTGNVGIKVKLRYVRKSIVVVESRIYYIF